MITHWFAGLPIHRKLVAIGLIVTTAALLAAMIGLILLDIGRYRVAARDDIASLARVIAENSAAALTFGDLDAATDTLKTARVWPVVTRACVYLPDGALFARYARSTERACLDRMPTDEATWTFVESRAPVTRNQRTLGTIYAERDLSDLGTRIVVTVAAGLTVLLFAAGLAYVVAQRVHRTVSTPIAELAAAARAAGPEQEFSIPPIQTAPDEVGELVHAFTEMVARVRESNSDLVRSNDALRREIEERRRMEAERETILMREREASRVKDEFLAAVSHELRTPLNAILGWAQILSSTNPNAETMTKAVGSIARNARAQTRVIEDLVDVSRIVTGKLSLRLEPVDLRSPMEAAAEVVRPTARIKNIEFDVRVPGEPCLVNGDSDRLQQIVWNLLSNAVKFTPVGGRVAATLAEVEGAYEMTVTDTGVGIPVEFLPHVFDRFRQADGSMAREHGGLGLGLAIVKELSEMHGGRVTVASEGRGRGAAFTVRLPQLIGLRDAMLHHEHPSVDVQPPVGALTGVTVLAVDDNADALEIIAVTLTGVGATVRVVESGEDAVRIWERDPSDVLICDLAMPDMTGFEVVRRIRAIDAPSGRQTRTIALSAHASPTHIAQSLEAGFDHHLAKPYGNAELIRLVAATATRS